jgi:RHS repeat-associated protein
MAATDLSGTISEEYVFFNGKRIARLDLPSGTVHYYFSDHLGSASVVTNADGTGIQDESDYYPFGGERPVVNNDPNQYKFTGKERDTETGLDYFGARYYGSTMGRWMSPDWSASPEAVPYADLTDPQTLNLYGYVRNNPMSHADADGHCDENGICGVLLGAAQGTGNFIRNTVVGAVQLAGAVAQDSGSAVPLNTGIMLATPVVNAVQDYSAIGVSGVTNAVLDQGAQGAMAITAEAVLTGGLAAYSLKTPIENAAAGIKGIGTGVPGSDVVVRGGTQPLPTGDQVYSGAHGPTLQDAGRGVPNGQVQASTASAIRKAGGQVRSAPEPSYDGGPINPRHVNIKRGQKTFSRPQPNPAPKPERVPGRP